MSFENAGLLLAFMDGAMLKELVGMMSAQAWRAAAVRSVGRLGGTSHEVCIWRSCGSRAVSHQKPRVLNSCCKSCRALELTLRVDLVAPH